MEIFDRVAAIIADQLGVEKESITRNTNFEEDLSADSLDIVEISMSIEEEFDIPIQDDALTEIHTVGDVVDMISALYKD